MTVSPCDGVVLVLMEVRIWHTQQVQNNAKTTEAAFRTRMAYLAYDIIAEIVDILADTDDYRSLFELSATCKSILHLCRARIFSVMTLVPRNWDGLSRTKSFRFRSFLINRTLFRVRAVEDLVESCPSILNYVRTLHLQSHQSNYHDTAYLGLLSMFDNLSSLSIQSYEDIVGSRIDPFKPKQSWTTFPESYRSSLVQLIQRSPIRKLFLTNVADIPRSILQPCRNLIHLTLYCATFSSDSNSRSPISPIQLKELFFRYDIEAASPLLNSSSSSGSTPIIDPASLETLAIELHDVHENGYEHEIVKNVSDLENLIIFDPSTLSTAQLLLNLKLTSLEVISYPTFLRNVMVHLHPNAYSTLTFLGLTILYHSPLERPNPMPTTVIHDLQFTALERLYITLKIELPAYEPLLLDNLGELDISLSNSPFSTLRTLSLTCSPAINTPESLSAWLAVPQTHLRRMSSSRSVEFKYSVF